MCHLNTKAVAKLSIHPSSGEVPAGAVLISGTECAHLSKEHAENTTWLLAEGRDERCCLIEELLFEVSSSSPKLGLG